MRSRSRALVALAAVALAAPFVPPGSAGAAAAFPGQDGDGATTTSADSTATTATTEPPEDLGNLEIRLLEAPVGREDDPRAYTYIVDHVAPGDGFSRAIAVTNNSPNPLDVRTYAGGADIQDAEFLFLDEDPEATGQDGTTDAERLDRAREVAEWTTIDVDEHSIEPGDQATITASIAVPDDAAPGERYGVVWAETRSPAPDGSGVIQVHRVGVRIYLSVGEGNEPASDFTIGDITVDRRDADGALVATAPVRNTGGRALDLSGTLELSGGPGGVEAEPRETDEALTLGVGQSGRVVVPIGEHLSAGDWDAELTLRSGTIERSHGNRVTLPGPLGDGGSSFEVPWTPIAATAGGLVGLGLVVLAARSLWLRRARPRATVSGKA